MQYGGLRKACEQYICSTVISARPTSSTYTVQWYLQGIQAVHMQYASTVVVRMLLRLRSALLHPSSTAHHSQNGAACKASKQYICSTVLHPTSTTHHSQNGAARLGQLIRLGKLGTDTYLLTRPHQSVQPPAHQSVAHIEEMLKAGLVMKASVAAEALNQRCSLDAATG
jgi:hypothetical protein